MSCEDCETSPISGAFYRWKNANVEIIGCKKHLLEIFDALSEAQHRGDRVAPPPAPEIESGDKPGTDVA